MSNNRVLLPGEATPETVLDVLVIPSADGVPRFRITRYCSTDGSRWVRHGPFTMYHACGSVSTEGEYRDGLEAGVWRMYYENGQLAAEGMYSSGHAQGYWQYWQRDGTEQTPVEYVDGVEVR